MKKQNGIKNENILFIVLSVSFFKQTTYIALLYAL